MKNELKLSILSVLVLASSPFAFSAGADEPCKQIKTACESAGFTKGGHKMGKGLFVDCMKPIMAGQSVTGVTVSSDQIAACKAKKDKHAAKAAAAKSS